MSQQPRQKTRRQGQRAMERQQRKRQDKAWVQRIRKPPVTPPPRQRP